MENKEKKETWFNSRFNVHYLKPIIIYFMSMLLIPIIVYVVLMIINRTDLNDKIVSFVTYSAMLIILLFVLRKDLKKDFSKPVNKEFLVTIALGFCVIYFVGDFGEELVKVILTRIGTTNTTSLNQLAIIEMSKSMPILTTITATIGAFIEELIFRFSFMNFIRNRKVAIIINSILFGCMHLGGFGLSELIMLVLYILMGFIFSYIYNKTDDIRISSAIHMLNNFLSLVMICIS